ncbi:myocardin isoform X1 [Coregonus clupeaformis]|uniref:myocardin isoform X1 n=1 Tax=Coregonus clupeaformis TaxID=59861 RepID=UPI001E1C45C3|nr:myocardin isoform X1 [Coregonus clupeaformis]
MNAVKTTEPSVHSKENRQSPGHLKTKEDDEDPRDRKDTRNNTTRKHPSTNGGKNVLQLRLQQRRTREQLADQGIMPHSAGDVSSVEAQLRLKRARLADDLNDKLALRPGPMELVHKNIIPLDSAAFRQAAAMTVNHGKFPKQEDSYAFEEDSSSDSLSPEQHHSDESQGSACPSSEAMGSTPSSSSSPALTSPIQGCQNRDPSDQSKDDGLSAANNGLSATPPIPVPAIVKSKTSDKNRHKKPKDVKPKVKKLKYHQYIPPDQKAEKSPPPMDSAYARLLQQQQLFLQLQILSQQKHAHTHSHTQHTHSQHTQAHAHQRQPSFSYQPLHQPVQAQKQCSEQLTVGSSSVTTNTINSSSSSRVKTTYSGQTSISPVKPGPLPANLDDLKVSELRQQLRIRGMPVSGTKTALIERLRPFKDPTSSPSHSGSNDVTTVTFPVTPTGSLSSYQSPSSSSALSQGGYYPYPSTSSTPPISPASSDISRSGSLPDSFSDVPMSSPPQFGLQPSPAQLSAEEGLGGGGLSGTGLRGGESGGMEGLEEEKDKMLVEKQKVIEELTWKLHQEQRQVEELKMQLHKRKRCHGATHEGILDPSQPHHLHLQQSPSLMGQHFFGVTVKQEPMSLSSSCPLSSPKHLKSPPGSCMEGMGHCGASLPNMGGPGGQRCLDSVPSSGSPSGMSAFLSPQCSPQDSPIAKTSSSSQPSSPNNPYLLSLPLGRDGCSHPLNQASTRPRNMQIQQKNGGQAVNCAYPSDQRGLQSAFPNSADNGLNHRVNTKGKNRNMQQKQLTRSQQMDELLDVLIESGEMPANAREARERSSVTKVVPHITVSPGTTGLAVPKFNQRHYEHLPPSQLNYDHTANHIADSHLETLLGSPLGRGGEVALLKMAAEEAGEGEEGGDGPETYPSPNHHHHPHQHPHQDKLLPNRDLMETPTPLSAIHPINAKVSSVAEAQGMVGMTFSESPWETMEWLDLTPPSSATGFNSVPPAGPSIFNTEFLDVTDINLNTAMDLHLEHW